MVRLLRYFQTRRTFPGAISALKLSPVLIALLPLLYIYIASVMLPALRKSDCQPPLVAQRAASDCAIMIQFHVG